MKKKKIVKDAPVTEEPKVIEPEKIEPKVEEKAEVKPEVKTPVTLNEFLEAGFVNLTQAESLQKQGQKVVEIKNIEGKTLYRLEDK